MPRHTKYHLPNSRKGGGRPFYWVGALLLLFVAAWVWWQSGRPQPGAAPRRQVPVPAMAKLPAGSTSARTNTLLSPPPQTKIRPEQTNAQPVTISTAPPITVPPPSDGFPRPVRNVFEAQLALARRAISCGSLDGVMGSQTRAALRAFQHNSNLPETGELDEHTHAALALNSPPLTRYVVVSNDLARLQPLSKTWLGKSQQTALDYETILELVAEKGHASPNLVRRLNPSVDWTNVLTGAGVQIPDAVCPRPAVKMAFAVISLGEKQLQAFDANTNLLAHFPCSIAARIEKRPEGELHVTAIAPNPNYTFDPEVFPELAEARELNRKLILPPGPNNPVGTAWISLDKPGYGIHGTPSPEQVGRTESHGCFRLANWNAEYLVNLVWLGMPVYIEP